MTNDTAMPTVEEIEAVFESMLEQRSPQSDVCCVTVAQLSTLRHVIVDQMRKSEIVASWWCAIESVEAIDGTNEIAMSWNIDDANGGEAARTQANQWINDQPHPGSFHLVKVYAVMKEDSHDH